MPTSSSYVITPVLSFISWLNPRSVLDVGSGYGQWGVLLRQHLDYPWDLQDGSPCWSRRIDGVEGWAHYRNPLWDFAYDRVSIADATEYLGRAAPHSDDLAVCIEVPNT